MTIAYSINGTTSFHGVQSSWQRVIKRKNANGTTDYQPYALHTWNIPQMEMTNYLSLLALSGTRLTSLETNAIADVNTAATYTAGVEVAIVNCSQVGRRAVGVTVTFRVDVT